MPTDSKVLKLVTELTRMTAQGELTWRIASPPESLVIGTNDLVPLYFESRFRDQRIGLAQRRSRLYDGEHDSFYWHEQIVVVFLDSAQRVLWESTEDFSSLQNLFDVVRFKSADVEGIFKKLLSD